MTDPTRATSFGLRYMMNAWSVVDLATEIPLTVRNRILQGLSREEADDALSLLKLLARLRTTPSAGLQEISRVSGS